MNSKRSVLAAMILWTVLNSIAPVHELKAQSGQKVAVTPRIGEGLNTTVFETPAGKINVNLPEDLAAGDTLSGTVLAEPVGQSPEEKAQASDELNGYVVEIKKCEVAPPCPALVTYPEIPLYPPKVPACTPPPSCPPAKKKTPCVSPKDPPFTCTIPPSVPAIDVCLTKNGTPVCTQTVPVPASAPPSPPNVCKIPSIGQCGHPIAIKAPCDGYASNSGVKIGDQKCPVLAESPRCVIAKSPRNVVGPCTLGFVERDRSCTAPFTNLQVKLTSPKTVLKKGESTTVTVTVTGLDNVSGPVDLRLVNNTPQTIDLEGGNTQSIPLK